MKKHLSGLFGLAAMALTALAATERAARAEGGCPNGFYPIGGNYCRNIVCGQGYLGSGRDDDQSAIEVLKNYGQSCNNEDYVMSLVLQSMAGGGKNAFLRTTKWGNSIIPMR